MAQYRTRDGDVIDLICKAHYGREDMTVTVYEANPGLAARGPVLPKGIWITLPDPTPETTDQPIRLWG